MRRAFFLTLFLFSQTGGAESALVHLIGTENARFSAHPTVVPSAQVQAQYEKCVREMKQYWHHDDASGNFVVQGPKSDTVSTDFYLFFTNQGLFRLNTRDIPAERPVRVKISAGEWKPTFSLSDLSLIDGDKRQWDRNSLHFSDDRAVEEENAKVRGSIHNVVLAPVEWNTDLFRFLEQHITDGFRSGMENSAARALVEIHIDRQAEQKAQQTEDLARIQAGLDAAELAYNQTLSDLRNHRIDLKTFKSESDAKHKERMFWVRLHTAATLAPYSLARSKSLTVEERAKALEILNSETTRFPDLIKAYPACQFVLKNSGRDLFLGKDDQGLIEYMRKNFAKLSP